MPTFNMQALDTELSLDEGRRSMPYRDSLGILTVGIGHNLQAGPLPFQRYPMSNAEIDALFAKDVASTVAKLDRVLPWWRSLSDVRQRVFINLTFNMGIGIPGQRHGLCGFPTFLHLVQTGQYAAASTDMLKSLWARQVGQRAVRLSNMMRSG